MLSSAGLTSFKRTKYAGYNSSCFLYLFLRESYSVSDIVVSASITEPELSSASASSASGTEEEFCPVFVSVSDTAVVAVRNITRTSCQIAVRLGALQEVYVSTSGGGTASTKVTVLSYPEFSAVTADVLAIYDGGITV